MSAEYHAVEYLEIVDTQWFIGVHRDGTRYSWRCLPDRPKEAKPWVDESGVTMWPVDEATYRRFMQ